MKPLAIKKGFTLIEISVVACIFSIVATAIGMSFISGMKLWGRFNSAGSNMDVLITLEMMAKDLRQSLDMPSVGFQGSSSEVSFPALDGTSILKVTYKFDSKENALLKSSARLKDIVLNPEPDKEKEYTVEKRLLSPEEFSLSYLSYDPEAQSYSWKDAWAKDKGIFPAVRIQAKFKNEEFSKVVFIPVS